MATAAADDALNEFLETRWWALALRGLFAVIFGIICFANPALAGLTLVLWFGIFSVADGIVALIASIGKARRGERWVWLGIEAVASIIVGVLVLTMPALMVTVIFIVIAIKTLITGILLLLASVKLDGAHGQGWLIFGGLASVAIAALLFAAPLMGAKILIWWIGAWAVIFGVALIAIGFKLKAFVKK